MHKCIPLGTGFITDKKGHIITAKHVIDEGKKYLDMFDNSNIFVGLSIENQENVRGSFTLVDFEVVDEDNSHDLLLLKLMKNPFKGEISSGIKTQEGSLPLLFGIPKINSDRPRDGEFIGISGYPLSSNVLLTNSGWLATSWGTEIIEEEIPGRPYWFPRKIISDVYFADIQVNPGNSGSPVYVIENASVIGVCVSNSLVPVLDEDKKEAVILGKRIFYNAGLTQIIPSKYVIELLKKNNAEFDQTEF
jgi:hypothetical protein